MGDEDALLLTWLERRFIQEVAYSLRVEPERVDIDVPFVDMGLDSLMAVEILGALKAELDLPISPAVLFDYPTIKELSTYLLREYGEELRDRTVVLAAGAG